MGIARVRGLPSPQLIGHPQRVDLDLNTLADLGVNIVGRLVGVQDRTAQFSGALASLVKMADLKQQRLLRSIDEWISDCGAKHPRAAPEIPAATRCDSPPQMTMKLGGNNIRTVIWATGFRPDYSWLNVPVLDAKGRLRHDGGITAASRRHRDCTRWVCRSCESANRHSCLAPVTMRAPLRHTWPATCRCSDASNCRCKRCAVRHLVVWFSRK